MAARCRHGDHPPLVNALYTTRELACYWIRQSARRETDVPFLMNDEQIAKPLELMKDGKPALLTTMLFASARKPSSWRSRGASQDLSSRNVGPLGERFSENEYMLDIIPAMLELAMVLVERNICNRTMSGKDGRRDKAGRPYEATREALLNTEIH